MMIFFEKRFQVDVQAEYFLLCRAWRQNGGDSETQQEAWRRFRGALEVILQISRLIVNFCRAHGASAPPPILRRSVCGVPECFAPPSSFNKLPNLHHMHTIESRVHNFSFNIIVLVIWQITELFIYLFCYLFIF